MAFLRTNSSSSISSLSSVGSDNAGPIAGKNVKGAVPDPTIKSRNIMQRTRDALGDIGNRLKKNEAPAGGKAVLKGKAETGTGQFAVPLQRPPRAAAGGKPKTKTAETTGVKLQSTTAKREDVAVSMEPTLLPPQMKSSPTALDTLSKLVDDIKTEHSSSASAVPFQEEGVADNKENVKGEEPGFEADIVNEYNPRLSTELAVEAFRSESLNIANIDVDEWNPLLVQVYIQDIYDYVFALEKKYPIRIRYLEGRLINSRMRAVLIDWLIEVHAQFGFMPETLYLAAKILDRYLQTNRNISRKQLQLVGVTAMYVAAKYEEVCTPAVQDFAAVSDNAFTVADVIKMEQDVLKTLSFDLAFPPSVLFLRRFSKAANATMAIHSMAKYIMELSIVDYAACHLYPSEQAAGSLALALLILENNKSLTEVWNPTVEHYSRYTIESIKPIVSILAGVVSRAQDESHKLKAVYKKYTGKRLNNTSLAPELKVESWRNRILKEVCKLQV